MRQLSESLKWEDRRDARVSLWKNASRGGGSKVLHVHDDHFRLDPRISQTDTRHGDLIGHQWKNQNDDSRDNTINNDVSLKPTGLQGKARGPGIFAGDELEPCHEKRDSEGKRYHPNAHNTYPQPTGALLCPRRELALLLTKTPTRH